MGAFSWLFGGNDHELARTQYPGQESASHTAAHADARRENRRRDRDADASAQRRSASRRDTSAARKGQEWEDADRARTPKTTGWFRGRG